MPGDLVPEENSSAWEIWCLGDFVPIILFCAQTIENDAKSTNLRKLGCADVKRGDVIIDESKGHVNLRGF